MKKMIFLAAMAVAMAVSHAAWAQAPADKKDVPKPEAKAEPAKAQPQKQLKAVKKSRRTQDARHCLQRQDNTEIIKCAEEFL